MAGSAKIVNLHSGEQRKAPSARVVPEPIQHLRQALVPELSVIFKSFFDACDDILFEHADKAMGNQAQNDYFISMRTLRMQQRPIEDRLKNAIDTAFSLLISGLVSSQSSAEPDTLSLVQNDDLELLVAKESMVSRANREHANALQKLALRLESIVQSEVPITAVPIGAEVLCSQLVDLITSFDLSIKPKLVILKVFEKTLSTSMGQLYSKANKLLAENGVLPTLSSSTSTKKTEGMRQRSESRLLRDEPLREEALREDASRENALYDDSVKSRQGDELANAELMSQSEALSNLSPSLNAGSVAISPEQLLALLTTLQHRPQNTHSSTRNSAVDRGNNSATFEASAANEHLSSRFIPQWIQSQTEGEQSLGRRDQEVINLVAMLFDFILQDGSLSPQVKTVISQLQVPITKVALLDSVFFTKPGHPARRLLNELSTAGLSCDARQGKNDGLYIKMCQVVECVLSRFEKNVSVFVDALNDFACFLEKEKRRAAVQEQRLLDAEDGRAKSEAVKAQVDHILLNNMKDHTFHASIFEFINTAWRQVMTVQGLKFGTSSDEFIHAVKVLQCLVWSIQPRDNAAQRQKLIKLVPQLNRSLRKGLDLISYNPFELSKILGLLDKVHLARIRNKTLPECDAVMGAEKASEMMDAETQQSLDDSHHAPGSSDVAMPASDQVEPEAAAKATQSSVEKDEFERAVDSFVRGSWFDLREASERPDQAGQTLRCRLAAVIAASGRYIFVNRNGLKVAEKSRAELIGLLKTGGLSPIDQGLLFDRALEQVVSGLRRSQHDAILDHVQ